MIITWEELIHVDVTRTDWMLNPFIQKYEEGVYINDLFASSGGGASAIKTSLMPDSPVEYAIFLHSEMLKLPDYFIRASIAHERGHIECGHLNDNFKKLAQKRTLRFIKAHFGIVCKRELEADSYAIKELGATIISKWLEDLIEIVPQSVKKELIIRKKHIMKNIR